MLHSSLREHNGRKNAHPAHYSLAAWITLFLLGLAHPALADTPVTLYRSFAGNINIVSTGGTLRTQADAPAGNPCLVTNSGSMPLSGIPPGSTITAAYLYWAGSGSTIDANVTFNGTAITADRTFTASYNLPPLFNFFSGFKDVTSLITGNGTYTFAALTVDTRANPYCNSSAVLSGFALAVIYQNPAEDLRVINVYDGFQAFRGNSITLIPANFRVPVSPVNGRHAVVSWEGDAGNSGNLNGFTENLTFNGNALTDALNPLNNQYNSTVNAIPSNTTYGADVDIYDISSYLTSGDTSATAIYSSGADLVVLSAQLISVTNEPVADVAITKSHAGNFSVGTNGVYTLNVSNNGPNDATGTITVTDTLPAGLSYVSATGTGWTCGAVGQTVTCTRPGPLANGASAPAVTLTVSVGGAAYPGVTNTATVSSGTFDNVSGNDTANDSTTVLAPDLSTSTKTWVDLNGGDADPGDVIRYTVTLLETGNIAAAGVTVTDDIPPNVTNFMVVSVPPGATDASTGAGSGANGNGYLNVTGISVPASGSRTVVFEVTVAAVPPGTLINNTATVTPVAGAGATPAAPTLTVSASAVPSSGNKPLYLYGAPGLQLSRTPTPGAPAYVNLLELASAVWTLAPVLQGTSTLDPTINPNVPVNLYLASNNAGGQNRNITVSLNCSGGGPTLTANRIINLSTTVSLQTFNLPLAAPLSCATGNTWRLTIRNNTTGGGSRELRVYPVNGGNISQAVLPTTTVINVDSVAVYDAAYPGGSLLATTPTNTTVYIRSVISDPFGSYDISGAAITITDSAAAVRVNAAAMTLVADSGAAAKTFEYAYSVPFWGPAGNWTTRVVGAEGTEGTISDFAQIPLNVWVPMPNILMLKSVQPVSDPVNSAVNPKAIPGAFMLYTVTASNQGTGPADAVVIIDPVPANMELFVSDLGAPGSGPALFTDGAVPSGLSYSFMGLGSGADSISFSNDNGATFVYTPVPDGNGCDVNITDIRINLSGSFAASAGAPRPSFTLQFRMRVK